MGFQLAVKALFLIASVYIVSAHVPIPPCRRKNDHPSIPNIVSQLLDIYRFALRQKVSSAYPPKQPHHDHALSRPQLNLYSLPADLPGYFPKSSNIPTLPQLIIPSQYRPQQSVSQAQMQQMYSSHPHSFMKTLAPHCGCKKNDISPNYVTPSSSQQNPWYPYSSSNVRSTPLTPCQLRAQALRSQVSQNAHNVQTMMNQNVVKSQRACNQNQFLPINTPNTQYVQLQPYQTTQPNHLQNVQPQQFQVQNIQRPQQYVQNSPVLQQNRDHDQHSQQASPDAQNNQQIQRVTSETHAQLTQGPSVISQEYPKTQ